MISAPLEEIIISFNDFIKDNAYGHLDEHTMVYIKNGYIVEFDIYYNNGYIFKQIFGDCMIGSKVYRKFYNHFYKISDTNIRPYLNENIEFSEEKFIETIDYMIEYMHSNFNSKYGYYNILEISYLLKDCKYKDLFVEKYSSRMKENMIKMIELFETKLSSIKEIIPLLYLLDQIIYLDSSKEYFDMLRIYMEYPDNKKCIYSNYNTSEYIRKIANDIYLFHNSII